MKSELEDELQRNINYLNIKIDKIIPEFVILNDMDDSTRVHEYIEYLDILIDKINSIDKLINNINRDEKLFKFPQTIFIKIHDIKNIIMPFYKLNFMIFKWQRHYGIWLDGPFDYIDSSKVCQITKYYYDEFIDMQKNIKIKIKFDTTTTTSSTNSNKTFKFSGIIDDPDPMQQPAPLKLCHQIIKHIDDFKKNIRLINCMCNPALAQRHWNEMSIIYGNNITPNAGTTLRKFIKLNITNDNIDKYEIINAGLNKLPIVDTLITERIYNTIFQAIGNNYIGATVAGFNATGKTETIKSLAISVLGRQFYIINCIKNIIGYNELANIIKGLISTGSWLCFENIFNNNNNNETFNFEGATLNLNTNGFIVITKNISHTFDHHDDIIKKLFRQVTLTQPDIQKICQVKLWAAGFINALVISKKIININKLCMKGLSLYDFGTRSIITIIRNSIELKLNYSNNNEDIDEESIVLRVIIDIYIPMLCNDNDILIFQGFIKDIFPNVNLPPPNYQYLINILDEIAIDNYGFNLNEQMKLKIIQILEIMYSKRFFIIVGDAMVGKTTILNILAKSLKWIIFDGPIEYDVNIEYNDSNDDMTSIVFETDDTSQASPAIISHCVNELYLVMSVLRLLDIYIDEITHCVSPNDGKINEIWLHASLIMSIINSLGSILSCHDEQIKFNEFCLLLWNDNNEKKPDIVKNYDVAMPNEGAIQDHTYIFKGVGQWKNWNEILKNNNPNENILSQLNSLNNIVQTPETFKLINLFSKCIKLKIPFIICGKTSTGKSLLMQYFLNNNNNNNNIVKNIIDSMPNENSHQQVQEKFLLKLNKIGKNQEYGQLKNKTCINFIDDLNLIIDDNKKTFILELIRQQIDSGHWYINDKKIQINDIMFLFSMTIFNDNKIRKNIFIRLMRHLTIFTINPISNDNIFRIYSSILGNNLKKNQFSADVMSSVNGIVNSTINVYKLIIENNIIGFNEYNIRDITNVINGCSLIHRESVENKTTLIKLWVHETLRVFGDKLLNKQQDNIWLFSTIKNTIDMYFNKESFDSIFDHLPKNQNNQLTCESFRNLIFCNFINSDETPTSTDNNNSNNNNSINESLFKRRKYEEVICSQDLLNNKIIGFINQYNEINNINNNKLDIIIFKNIVEHLIRLCRSLSIPGCNLLMLCNNGAIGKRTLTRLAAFIQQQEYYEMLIDSSASSFNDDDDVLLNLWKKKLKEATKQSGGYGRDCTFFIPERYIRDEYLIDISNIMTTGQVTHLLSCENEVQKIIEISRLPAQCGDRNLEIEINQVIDIDMLKQYKYILALKQDEIKSTRNKYLGGLKKMDLAANEVLKMKKILIKLRPELELSAKQTIEKMKQIEDENISVANATIQVKRDEEIANNTAEIAATLKTECEADLAVAIPILEDAIAALNTLKPTDITLVKAMKNPPDTVKNVISCICVMLNIPADRVVDPVTGKKYMDYWGPSKRILGDMNFLQNLKDYDKDNIPIALMQVIKKTYISDKNFMPHIVAKASSAAEGLCKWVRAMVSYDDVAKIVAPKRAREKIAAKKCLETMTYLNEKRKTLVELNEKLNILNEDLKATLAKKLILENQVDNCTKKLDKAEALIANLYDENNKWIKIANKLELFNDNLPIDILICCAIIYYLSSLDEFLRNENISIWKTYLINENIKFTNFNITNKSILKKCLESSSSSHQWQVINDWSFDNNYYNDNLIIMKYNSRLWCLFIDPQNLANIWIRKIETKNKLVILNYTDPFINFQLPEDGLNDCLLNILITREKPDLQEKYIQLKEQCQFNNNILKEKEINILTTLSNPISSTISILEDENAMKILDSFKQFSLKVKIKQEKFNKIQTEIESIKIMYIEFSYYCTKLYKNYLSLLDRLDDMYKYSLNWFIQLYTKSITTSNKSIDIYKRLKYLKSSFTQALYTSIQNSLFEKHKLLNSFLLCVTMSMVNNYIQEDDWKFLLNHLSMLNEMNNNNNDKLIEKEKILVSLEKINNNNYNGIVDDLKINNKWNNFYDSDNPGVNDFPEPWKSKLSNFQKIIIMTVIRPNKVIKIIHEFISMTMKELININLSKLNEQYCFDDIVNDSYSQSSFLIPLIFILPSYFEPYDVINAFANKFGYSSKIIKYTIGACGAHLDEINLTKLIKCSQINGDWLLIENFHIASKQTIAFIENIYQDLIRNNNISMEFRLWLSSRSTKKLPIVILENSIKITCDEPITIKQTLIKCYHSEPLKNPKFFSSCPGKDKLFSKMLYSMAFFHGILREKNNFGIYAWNVNYNFNHSDFVLSINQ
ncbi:dynein axonemal heavy chain 7-like, partial [Aphidius gifuensis]|uniref:dynein axonemal heavy chain 7-like n=1 Tax=Aphidius gifuensis TaxID=684658 RepID=UPI001CDB67CB